MLWILFLIFLFSNGFFAANKLASKEIRPAASFFLGSLFSVTITYLLAIVLNGKLFWAIILFFILSTPLLILNLINFKKVKINFKLNYFLINLIIFILIFFLFQKAFSYNQEIYQFLISSNTYLDMGAHIPTIRSFSLGSNIPFEVPFFAGKGLQYHFLFYFFIGVLEFLGLRIDFAFNLISAFSFYFLLFLIYKFSFLIFKNNLVAFFSTFFTFCFSDLSILKFISDKGFNIFSFWNNQYYPSGYFLGIDISRNFLNINTYLNQRHLIFSFGIVILVCFLTYLYKLNSRQIILIGLTAGLLPFWNITSFLSMIFILISFLFYKSFRKSAFYILVIAFLIAIPQLILMKIGLQSSIIFKPGYLINKNLDFLTFLLFWFWNIGIALPFGLIGIIKSNKFQKLLFYITISLFIIPNLFQFSSDIFDNHKFFNLWIIFFYMFSAYGLIFLFKKSKFIKLFSLFLFLLILLSSTLNLLVVKNDVYAKINDYERNKLTLWIKTNIQGNKFLITNGEIYDPASLVGRKTFLGRSHYIFLYGANPSERIREREVFFKGDNFNKINEIIKLNKLEYVVIYKKGVANLLDVNIDFLNKKFTKIYEDEFGLIYKI